MQGNIVRSKRENRNVLTGLRGLIFAARRKTAIIQTDDEASKEAWCPDTAFRKCMCLSRFAWVPLSTSGLSHYTPQRPARRPIAKRWQPRWSRVEKARSWWSSVPMRPVGQHSHPTHQTTTLVMVSLGCVCRVHGVRLAHRPSCLSVVLWLKLSLRPTSLDACYVGAHLCVLCSTQ